MKHKARADSTDRSATSKASGRSRAPTEPAKIADPDAAKKEGESEASRTAAPKTMTQQKPLRRRRNRPTCAPRTNCRTQHRGERGAEAKKLRKTSDALSHGMALEDARLGQIKKHRKDRWGVYAQKRKKDARRAFSASWERGTGASTGKDGGKRLSGEKVYRSS